jgi:SAM-dependent methyltransferase
MNYLGVTNSATQHAHVTATGLDCLLGDFANVPVNDGIADVVMFNETIGYGDLTALLEEALRLLQPGGVLFIKDFDAPSRYFSADWCYHLTPATLVLQELSSLGFENIVMQSPIADYDRFNKFMVENQYMKATHSNGALNTTSVIRAIKRKGA